MKKNSMLKHQIQSSKLDEEQRHAYEDKIKQLENDKSKLLAQHQSSVMHIKAEFEAAMAGYKAGCEQKILFIHKENEQLTQEITILHKELELLQLSRQDGNLAELQKWFKEQIEMVKIGNNRRLDEIKENFEKEALKWTEEKLQISTRYENKIRELQFVEENWKKKYEVILTQEVGKRQEAWQHAYEELKIEINVLRDLLKRKDAEI